MVCEICKKNISKYGISSHVTSHNLTTKEYYDKYIKIEDEGICKNCKGSTSFIGISKGYTSYCSIKCANSNKDKKEKTKKTCLERYGVENPNKSLKIKKKKENTCLEKYGVKTPFHSNEIQRKAHQSLQLTYTNIILEKKRKTWLKKYGVDHPFKNETIKKKIRKTWLKKYGVDHPFKADVIQQKRKDSCLKNNSVEYPFQSREVQNKINQSCIDKYGYIRASQHPDIKQKIRDNNKKWPTQNHISQNTLDILNDKESFLKLLKENSFSIMSEMLNIGYVTIIRYARSYGFNGSFKTSNIEYKVKDLLEKNTINFKINDRTQIYPLELDFYLPDYNLAIEVHGIYWHSEQKGKDRNYHLNKYRLCKEKGIKLLQFYENEIYNKWPIVESIIKSNLGLNTSINANNCLLKEVGNRQVVEFLNSNHIHGYKQSIVNIGLYYSGKLVSIMTFNRKDSQWKIVRYCDRIGTIVVDGIDRLFQWFRENYSGSTIAYCDLRIDGGDIYRELGFSYLYDSSPSCYEDGNNRIWDCGNGVWINK